MQDNPNNLTGPSQQPKPADKQPSPIPGPADNAPMPKPITPPGQPGISQDTGPLSESELLSLLDKTNQNTQPILSKFPSPGSGSAAVKPPASTAEQPVAPVPPPPVNKNINGVTENISPPFKAAASTGLPKPVDLPVAPRAPVPPPRPGVFFPNKAPGSPAPPKPNATLKPNPNKSSHKLFRMHSTRMFSGRGKLFIPLFLAATLFILFSAPWTRYRLAGVFIKKDVSVRVMDATTGLPLSNAQISSEGSMVLTDGEGRATLPRQRPGPAHILIDKPNYTRQQLTATIPIIANKDIPPINLRATGALVRVRVKNLISRVGLSGVHVDTAAVSSTTNKDGDALLALSDSGAAITANLSLDGYNDKTISLSPSAGEVVKLEVSLTPAGKAYYLSKSASGVNVMSVNLDGSGAKNLLLASGYEDSNTTLLASPDNQYLALVSRRTADPHPQLYIIDAASGKMAEADFGPLSFRLYGWLGDTLVYSTQNQDTHTWQAGKNTLKSYDAVAQKSYTLNKSMASGNATASAYQVYSGVLLADNVIIYGLNWQTAGQLNSQLSDKDNTLMASSPHGNSVKTLAKYAASSFLISYKQHLPNSLYLRRTSVSGGNTYFDYVAGNDQPKPIDLSEAQFEQNFPKYYFSPDGQHTLWVEKGAKKDNLAYGGPNAEAPTSIYSGEDLEVYGWHSEDYILISQRGAIYSLDISGGKPVKVANYFGGR